MPTNEVIKEYVSGGRFDLSNLPATTDVSLSSKFILEIDGIDIAMIDGVTRPGYKIETEQFQLMEYQFNFPKTIKFDNTITFNVVELLDPTIGITQMQVMIGGLLASDFYATPSAIGADITAPLLGVESAIKKQAPTFGAGDMINVSKKSLNNSLPINRTNVSIHTLDVDGNIYDSIKLINPMITEVKPSALKYTSDEVNKIQVTITFDYADYGREGVYNYGTFYNKAQQYFPNTSKLITK